MEINKLNTAQTVNNNSKPQIQRIKETGLKEDTFNKAVETVTPEEADAFLLDIKNAYGTSKFINKNYRESIVEQLKEEPEKWTYVKQLAPRNNMSPLYLNRFLELKKDDLDKVTELALMDDKDGKAKFLGGHINDIIQLKFDNTFENVKILAKTDLGADNIVKAVQEKGLDCKKVANKVDEMSALVGNDLQRVVLSRDAYSKGDYTIKVTKTNKSEIEELLDNNLNRYALETTDYYESQGKSYKIKKSNDYRNNIVSKVRYTIDKNGNERPTHEVRILKDKNGKVKRTEYTEPSEITGVMNVKYQYPDGRVEQVSSGTVDKKTGISTIKKNMVSASGTRTEYLFQDDPQGNRLSDYKITDKNGKVLLNNSETFEVVSSNKFITSKNDKKYEINAGVREVTVKDLSNPERVATFGRGIFGEQEEIIKVLKKMPGEELFKMKDNVKTLQGTTDILKSYSIMDGDTQLIYSGNDLFVILHELGHAVDMKDVDLKNPYYTKHNAIFEDKKFNEIYAKEKEAFNKQFPDAQRNHIAYFIDHENHYNGEKGGLKETIAESNALLTTAKSHEVLAMRSQYLQQHFPETIAYLNDKLNEGKQVLSPNFSY